MAASEQYLGCPCCWFAKLWGQVVGVVVAGRMLMGTPHKVPGSVDALQGGFSRMEKHEKKTHHHPHHHHHHPHHHHHQNNMYIYMLMCFNMCHYCTTYRLIQYVH